MFREAPRTRSVARRGETYPNKNVILNPNKVTLTRFPDWLNVSTRGMPNKETVIVMPLAFTVSVCGRSWLNNANKPATFGGAGFDGGGGGDGGGTGAEFTVRVKFCVALLPTPFCAMMVK